MRERHSDSDRLFLDFAPLIRPTLAALLQQVNAAIGEASTDRGNGNGSNAC